MPVVIPTGVLRFLIRMVNMEVRSIQTYFLQSTMHASLNDISHMVGFLDADYFSKAFKKRYQISPTDVKKGMQKIMHPFSFILNHLSAQYDVLQYIALQYHNTIFPAL